MRHKKNYFWMILMVGLLISLGFMSNSARAESADLPRGEMSSAAGFDYELVTVPVSNDGGEISPKLLANITAPAATGCTLDTTGAISHWQLDESAGATTFVDSIGGYNGTCSGSACPSPVSGAAAGAQYFIRDEADVINVPSTTAYDWTAESNFSVGVWVKTTQDCTGNKVFIGRYKVSLIATEGSWWLGCVPGGVAKFRMRDSDLIIGEVTGSTVINDGKWHFITGVRVGVDPDPLVTDDDKILLYVDGVLEGTDTPVEYTGILSSTDVLTMGAYEEPTDYYFNGALDEAVIFGTVWDPAAYYGTCRAPEVTTPADQTDDEGDTIVPLQIVASDPDSDPLTYSAVNLPDGLDINPSTGLISGTISYTASIGSPHQVQVTVSDGKPLGSTTIDFDWTVADTNRAPEVTMPADQVNIEGGTVSLQIEATDPDGDSLEYSALGLPPGLSINSSTGLISGVIDSNVSDFSPYNVTVSVDDGIADLVQVMFNWTIESPINYIHLPLISGNPCTEFFDDFSDPTSGWYIGEDEDASYEYLNGEYRVLSKNDIFLNISSAPSCDRNNYTVEVDARWESTSGTGYGIIFGFNWYFDEFYLFEVNADYQDYSLLHFDGVDYHTIVPYTYSPSPEIRSGTASNHLKITRNGSQITIEVNGNVLGSWIDNNITGASYSGVFSASYEGYPTSDARFDNYSVSQLNSMGQSLVIRNSSLVTDTLPRTYKIAPHQRYSPIIPRD